MGVLYKKNKKQHQMLDQNIDEENPTDYDLIQWRSCCFVIDKSMVFFSAQLFISLFVLCFCVFRLINPELPSGARQMWSATFTFILGT